MTWRMVAFLALSAPIVIVSRASLAHPRSHGFWRFLAWEAIVALFVLHVDRWFTAPFSWHQLVSWALLALSVAYVVWGVALLRAHGRAAAGRAGEPGLYEFEKTTALVTTGIYRHVRHPLYGSLLLLAWGIFFKQPSWAGAVLAGCTTVFLFVTAKADESECRRVFGSAYDAYMRRTKRFVPYVV